MDTNSVQTSIALFYAVQLPVCLCVCVSFDGSSWIKCNFLCVYPYENKSKSWNLDRPKLQIMFDFYSFFSGSSLFDRITSFAQLFNQYVMSKIISPHASFTSSQPYQIDCDFVKLRLYHSNWESSSTWFYQLSLIVFRIYGISGTTLIINRNVFFCIFFLSWSQVFAHRWLGFTLILYNLLYKSASVQYRIRRRYYTLGNQEQWYYTFAFPSIDQPFVYLFVCMCECVYVVNISLMKQFQYRFCLVDTRLIFL